jgi:hypothetical protein
MPFASWRLDSSTTPYWIWTGRGLVNARRCRSCLEGEALLPTVPCSIALHLGGQLVYRCSSAVCNESRDAGVGRRWPSPLPDSRAASADCVL